MCGVFGYLSYLAPRSRREAINVLLQGLQRMEYRGYDSAGLAVDSFDVPEGCNQPALLVRCKGTVSSLEQAVQGESQRVVCVLNKPRNLFCDLNPGRIS